MPESVTDRPTKAHSTVFLLSKSPRYFYDQEAIREAYVGDPEYRNGRVGAYQNRAMNGEGDGTTPTAIREPNPAGANARSVWTIPTEPTPFAHFATWPQKLVQRMILAGTSERGVCPECGAPWVREVERETAVPQRSNHLAAASGVYGAHREDESRAGGFYPQTVTAGWAPSCKCRVEESGRSTVKSGSPNDPAPEPCIVLDPFGGSGTTAIVARKLGRKAILVELNPEYCELAAGRLAQQSLFAVEA